MKKISWFAFFLILAASCLDDPDCFQLQNNRVGITFRVLGTGQGDSLLLKGFGENGTDEIITSFGVDLNYFKEQVMLGFSLTEGNNFLSLGYTVKNQFVSEDCGSRFVLSDLKILGHDFDSARVINSTPTPTGVPNIDIYRCPETDTLTINFNQLTASVNGTAVSGRTSAFISHPFQEVTTDFSDETVYSGSAATLHLPVNLLANQTEFVFDVDGVKDTLVVSYDLTTEQRYRACGVQTFVSNLRIKNYTFDSLSFALNREEEPQRTLLDPHVPNLRIFDCPELNLLQVNFRSGTAAANVLIKGVTADHITGNLLKKDTTVSTLNLPVDTESNVSNFYIEYADRKDTLSLVYDRIPLQLFNACGAQILIRNLREGVDLGNAQVLTTGTSLQFPPIPNVAITVN